MSAPDKAPQGLPYPAWFGDLVDRAAAMVAMRDLRLVSVPFEWMTQEGDELQFVALLKWRDGEPAPRVQVFYMRTGAFVCQSQVGDLYRIDPAEFCVDATVAVDEIEHTLWRQDQEQKANKAGGAR